MESRLRCRNQPDKRVRLASMFQTLQIITQQFIFKTRGIDCYRKTDAVASNTGVCQRGIATTYTAAPTSLQKSFNG